jgi:hypothetical protein
MNEPTINRATRNQLGLYAWNPPRRRYQFVKAGSRARLERTAEVFARHGLTTRIDPILVAGATRKNAA